MHLANKPFENVAKFMCLRVMLTDQIYIQYEIQSILNLENAVQLRIFQ
jgi:hypothetical protein